MEMPDQCAAGSRVGYHIAGEEQYGESGSSIGQLARNEAIDFYSRCLMFDSLAQIARGVNFLDCVTVPEAHAGLRPSLRLAPPQD